MAISGIKYGIFKLIGEVLWKSVYKGFPWRQLFQWTDTPCGQMKDKDHLCVKKNMSGCKDDTCRNHVLQCQTLRSGFLWKSSRNTAKFSWLVQFSFKLLLISAPAIFCCCCFQVQSKNVCLICFYTKFIWYTMNWATVDQDTLTI